MTRIHFSAFVLIALTGACDAQPLSPAQLTRDIHSRGARTVVEELDRAGRFDTVLSGIASGKAAWIRVAPAIANGTDAGDSTGLSVALAQALPKNPRAVLQVLDDGPVTGAGAVCGVPFIEPPPREVAAYLNKTIPAVTRVPATAQFSQRSACLAALTRAQASSTSRN
ncbi:MAG: hypothetical protein QOC89_2627 [Paraburkholderia sp.]|uniref:hypothetical protein n=1 Tax=Paraburkholderia sp. TaxID=1926495 RepID=UPI002B00158F|nr:hypothetical protein [Paraburkholderia sp.]MEA3084930.1 hypothetical protein [Paraburkholderia sp.]